MLVVFLGPPGAGKGTQSSRLSAKYGLPKISTGDMLRDAVATMSELGHQVRDIMDSGKLVDDDTMALVVQHRLAQPDTAAGAILDGYPRTLGQVETLDRLLEQADRGGVDLVLFLDVDENALVERLSRRRACTECGANYHLSFSPPSQEAICDRCGGVLVQREDDREDVVRDRLRVYHERTEPLVEHYERRGLLHRVRGSGDMDDVFARIDEAVGQAVRA